MKSRLLSPMVFLREIMGGIGVILPLRSPLTPPLVSIHHHTPDGTPATTSPLTSPLIPDGGCQLGVALDGAWSAGPGAGLGEVRAGAGREG
eukprot:gene24319-biopygen2902